MDHFFLSQKPPFYSFLSKKQGGLKKYLQPFPPGPEAKRHRIVLLGFN
jgi:hypothetical protein